MSEMDKLLAQLKAEYEQEKPSSKPSSSATPLPQKSKHKLEDPSNQKLNSLLSDLKAEFTGEQPQKLNKPPQKPAKTISATPSSSNRSTPLVNDNLIKDLQAEYQAKEQEEQQRRQQELIEQQKREQAKAKRRREALRQEAQEWLKNLNLNSDEGLWFEEFSYSYDSKLEAAIDYLQAIRETRRLG